MSWRKYLRRRWWDQEREREIDAYLETETAENIARGMAHEEAAAAAHRKFGNSALVREEIYRMNTIGWVESAWQDLRYGARLLRLSPGFAAVAIVSLALGIGANTAIFQLLDAVWLRSLPVPHAEELVEIQIPGEDSCCSHSSRNSRLTTPLWEQIRTHHEAFSGVFAWSNATFNLARRGGEARFTENGLWVSGDFFGVLGVMPMRGRVFTAPDDRRGCDPVAVVSYPFWQRELGGDAAAVGSTIVLDEHPFQVIGVTPRGFFGIEVGRSYDVAVPLCSEPLLTGVRSRLEKTDEWWLGAIGRLKSGHRIGQASSYMSSISPGAMKATIPPHFAGKEAKRYLGYRLSLSPAGSGVSQLRRQYGMPLRLLLSISGLVLLIGCANLANLMLARACAREREMAVRLAIGASRGRLIRQLLSESLLLAGLGAGLAVLLAQSLTRYLVSFLSTEVDPVFVALDPDWRVLAFIVGVAALTCVLFGLTPALRAARTDPRAAMKSGARGMTADRGRFGLRRALVAAQIAVSLVLLVGALLFVRSFNNLLTFDTGFQQEGILETDVDLRSLNSSDERLVAVRHDLLRHLRAIPGVEAAASTAIVPIAGDSWHQYVYLDSPRGEIQYLSSYSQVSSDYFKTLRTPLLSGRDFDDHDTPASPRVAIVNESFARRFLAGKNPVGAAFRKDLAPGRQAVYQIVGLVKDTIYDDLREGFGPIAYLATSQDSSPGQYDQILLRSNLPPAGLKGSVKRAIAEVHPRIAFHFHVFQEQIRYSMVRERLMATLSGLFGLLAVTLAVIGIYGVISYMVTGRSKEIGIRMALGAERRGVVGLILREAAVLLGFGLACGAALALFGARAAASLLFGLKPYDPVTLALAIGGLAVVAVAASYLPARRAAGVDPMTALRDE